MKRAALPGGLLLLTAFAATAAPSPGFDRLVRTTATLCADSPSTVCTAHAFSALDLDHSGELSLNELGLAREQLGLWTDAQGEQLPAAARHGIGGALQVVDLIGLERALYLYDTDGDGGLTLKEATQDLRLDERPIGEIYAEGGLIDWSRIRAVLGPSAFLLDYLGLK